MTNSHGMRLREAMDKTGKTDRDGLAKAMGISVQAVGMVLSGKTKALTAENTSRAAQFLGISTDWLAAGHGQMLSNSTATNEPNDIATALSTIQAALSKLNDEQRKEAGSLLAMYAANPRESIKQVILEMLGSVANKPSEHTSHLTKNSPEKLLKKG